MAEARGLRPTGRGQFEQVEAAGIEEVICYFNFGLLGNDETVRQMERVSREVMPHFARVAALV